MNNNKQFWLVGIGGSEADGVTMRRVYGTNKQVQEYLMTLIKEERANVEDGYDTWEWGTEKIKDLSVDEHMIYGYNCYSNFHTDFQAIPEPDVIEL